VIYQDHGSTIDGGFFPFQALDVAAQFAFGSSFQLKYEPAVHVGIQNFRMHVAFAADVGVLPSLPATFSIEKTDHAAEFQHLANPASENFWTVRNSFWVKE